jgi:transcriptional regulator with XRE-family HTH domain
MYFGRNLKYLMKLHKISGEELGKMLGKSKSAVSTYVNEAISPSMEDLILIRNTFKVNLDELFFTDLSSGMESKSLNKLNIPVILDSIIVGETTLSDRVKALEKKVKELETIVGK